FLLSFVALGSGINRIGIAAAYADPVRHIRAQDESIYAASALRLANQGGWLTPRVLGRYLLYKPPMLLWLSGLSLRWFGWSLRSLRLPSLVAGALATTLVFAIVLKMSNLWAAWMAVLLLLSNSMWQTFSRLCYTDMLLAACMVGAL